MINIPDVPEKLQDTTEFCQQLKLKAEDSLSKNFTPSQINAINSATTVDALKAAVKNMLGL